MSYDERLKSNLREAQVNGFEDTYTMEQLWRMSRRADMCPVIHGAGMFGALNCWYLNAIFSINKEFYYWFVGYNKLPLNSFCMPAKKLFAKTQINLDIVPIDIWHRDNIAHIDDIQEYIRHPHDLNILTNAAGPNKGRVRQYRDIRNKHWQLLTDKTLISGVKLGVIWRALDFGALMPVFRVDDGMWCIQFAARGINS